MIEYIKNQEEHHREIDFDAELRALLAEAGIEPDSRDPQFRE